MDDNWSLFKGFLVFAAIVGYLMVIAWNAVG